MNTKKHPNKLQRNSGLFLQLGLVLTLFTAYAMLEFETQERTAVVIIPETDFYESDSYMDESPVFEIERPVVKNKPAPIEKPTFIEEFIKSDDPDETESELLVKPTDEESKDPVDDVDSRLVVVETEDPGPETVEFLKIEDVPVFPGCEKKKTNALKRACFSKKMSKFIGRKFNSDLANQLGLSSGKQKIYVSFLIEKTGEIRVERVRASHKRLEKEGKRVVDLLPTMIPGKQRGKAVNVRYVLPITFRVD